MEPKIIDQNEMKIVGMVYCGNPVKDVAEEPEQNEVGKIWVPVKSKQ